MQSRRIARDANEDSVVLRYIQFMLAQQQFARAREAEARTIMQEKGNASQVNWWFETEGRKFVCFYLWLAAFEEREINVSEMEYHLAKSREFCSRTLTAAKNLKILHDDNTLPEEVCESIEERVLTFIKTKPALAFTRTAMVRMMMKMAVVLDSEDGAKILESHDIAFADQMKLADFESVYSDVAGVSDAAE